jgi:acyl-CoA dehydrogenase
LQWPFLADAHRTLARDLDAWCQVSLGPDSLGQESHDHHDIEEATRTLVRALGDGGWLKHAVVAPHGGTCEQLDVRSLCLCRETLARHWPLADFAFAMQGLGCGPISLFGSEEQKARFLPPVSTGHGIAAFAISEAHAGSDVAAMRTTATPDGDAFVLDGAKTWISNAGLADHYVVFARVGNGPDDDHGPGTQDPGTPNHGAPNHGAQDRGTQNLAAFIVEADRPGLTISERIETLAPHPLGTLTFTGCRVPRANLIDSVGAGFRIAMATLDVFRSTVGAAALGMARRALDESVAFTQQRIVDGAPLAAKQMTQAKLADMAVAIDQAALLIYRAAWTKDCLGGRISREAAMAKLVGTEAAQRVIDDAVQLFGAQGLVRGSIPEALYREVRALRIYEGTSEIQRLIIARQVLSSLARTV